ncbi:translation elongation factor Ts, partial [Treponema pallidum]
MEIAARDVKSLRDKTGAGMMECKRALQECAGDALCAEKYLKERGLAAIENRRGRATAEGVIVIKARHAEGAACGASAVAMVELVCETDFVAKNAEFIALAERIAQAVLEHAYTEVNQVLRDMVVDLATRVRENMSLTRLALLRAGSAGAGQYLSHYVHPDKKTGVVLSFSSDAPDVFLRSDVRAFAYDCCLHAAAYTPRYVRAEDVPAEYVREQREVFQAHVASLQKPAHVKESIVQGKLEKHLAEICFLKQPFVKDDKLSVEKKMAEVGARAGGALRFTQALI